MFGGRVARLYGCSWRDAARRAGDGGGTSGLVREGVGGCWEVARSCWVFLKTARA